MPDPRALYIVTAVVVLGLIAWVVAVLARRDNKLEVRPLSRPAAPPEPASVDAPPPRSELEPATEPPQVALPRPSQRPRLQSHSEIQDDPAELARKKD